MSEKNQNVDKDFQDFFLKSPLGPKVLGKILDNVEFLDIPEDEEQQVKQDHVKRILRDCGIGLGLTGEQYVRALMTKALTTGQEMIEVEDGNE